MDVEQNPAVSVIVPARNEEASLAACLESLVAQAGINFEIIVVDDASTDRTAEIAQSFAAVQLISAPPLPAGWTGKNNAMVAGAKIGRGKWLLFTDADTVHKPGSLTRAVREAEENGAALLSYSPEQEVRTFGEKAVMPVIFAELAATYPPSKVSDSASPIAAANGQYLLISREAYDAVGGHAKIASDLLEDVAMARLVKSSGRKIFFRYGGDAVRTRMYRSWEQMKEGWTKNLALLFPRPVLAAIWNFLLFYLLLALPISVALELIGVVPKIYMRLPWPRFVFVLDAVTGFTVIAALVFAKLRKANFRTNLVVAVFGLPIFSYLLLRSQYLLRKGGLSWKDRTYIYSNTQIERFRQHQKAVDANQLYNILARVFPQSWFKGKTLI